MSHQTGQDILCSVLYIWPEAQAPWLKLPLKLDRPQMVTVTEDT